MHRKSPSQRFYFQLVLGAAGLLLVVVGMAFYTAIGFALDAQISGLFAQKRCLEMSQYQYFRSLYPQSIFSSLYHSYDGFEQCQIKLQVERTVSAGNSEAALTQIGAYLAAYPHGQFSLDLYNQAGLLLSLSGKDLLAKQEYSAAADAFTLLLNSYPLAPAAQNARADLSNTRLLWAKTFAKEKNYPAAEKILAALRSDLHSSPQNVAQTNQALSQLYVAWGDAQVQANDYENGIKHYALAEEISPDTVDYDALALRAQIRSATRLADKSDFDRALLKIDTLKSQASSDALQAELDAARQQILLAYSHSDSLQAKDQINNALTLICKGQRPALPIFGLDTGTIRFGLVTPLPFELPAGWGAQTPSELHYVACATESKVTVEICAYTGGHTFTRGRYIWDIILFDAATGQQAADTQLSGSEPSVCAHEEYFSPTASGREAVGNRPTMDQIIGWLKKLELSH